MPDQRLARTRAAYEIRMPDDPVQAEAFRVASAQLEEWLVDPELRAMWTESLRAIADRVDAAACDAVYREWCNG